MLPPLAVELALPTLRPELTFPGRTPGDNVGLVPFFILGIELFFIESLPVDVVGIFEAAVNTHKHCKRS